MTVPVLLRPSRYAWHESRLRRRGSPHSRAVSEKGPHGKPHLRLLAAQISKFGVVGVVATFLNIAVYGALIELAHLPAQAANVIGFVTAVIFSFVGHSRWTFKKSGSGIVFIKFAVTAVTGLGLNSVAVQIIVEWLAAPYFYAIPFMVFVTPPTTFLIAKFWAFR